MSVEVLSAITAAARRAAAERSRGPQARAIEREAASRATDSTRFPNALAGPGVRIIAECKRRSPSRGVLRSDYDPAAIARAYERAGAAAISVLTEATFFDGALDHLRHVRDAVGLPLLRKDFIVSPFQVVEARAAGADAVLLIAAVLDDQTLRALVAEAAAVGLAALVEAHNGEEVRRAVDVGARIIGVNSRNLRTLEVTPALFDQLAEGFPGDVIRVAESGLRAGGDLRRLRSLGYDAFLIGERFMAVDDPGEALSALRRDAGGGEEA